MDIVTYKAISKLWKTLAIVGGGAVIYGMAINYAYKKLKRQNRCMSDELDDIRLRLSMLERKNED